MRNSVKALMLSVAGALLSLSTMSYAGLNYTPGTAEAGGYLPLTGGEMIGPIYINDTLAMNTSYSALPQNLTWGGLASNGNNLFVAVAYKDSGDVTTSIGATSSDGIIWTQQLLAGSDYWWDIAFGGSTFCAISGDGPNILTSSVAGTSPDGVTWTSRSLPSASTWRALAWNGTVFCAIAANTNKAATSPTGVTWTARTLPATAYWYDIAWNGTVFCAISGNNSDVAATSTDGATWTQRTLPIAANWWKITSFHGLFCAITSDSDVAATSNDGITWTQQTLPISAGWSDIAATNTGFIASMPGNIARSYDGTNWELLPASLEQGLVMCWDGTTLCGLSGYPDNSSIAMNQFMYQQNPMDKNVTMTSANTYYDGPSITLPSGTWLINASATCLNNNAAAANITCKLWNGTTVVSSAQMNLGNAIAGSRSISGIVHVGATAETWKISCASTATNGFIEAATTVNSSGNNATTISAIRISN